MALAHMLRLVYGVPVIVGDYTVPMWMSGVGFLVPGALAFMLWRGTRR